MKKHLGTVLYIGALIAIVFALLQWASHAPIPSSIAHTAPIASRAPSQPSCRGAAGEMCEYLAANNDPMIPAACPYGWRVAVGDICYNPKHPTIKTMMLCPPHTTLITQDGYAIGERAYCLLPSGMQSICLLPAVETGYVEGGDSVQCVNLPRVASRADLASGYYAPPCGTFPGYVACYAPCWVVSAAIPAPCQPVACSPSGECATKEGA